MKLIQIYSKCRLLAVGVNVEAVKFNIVESSKDLIDSKTK